MLSSVDEDDHRTERIDEFHGVIIHCSVEDSGTIVEKMIVSKETRLKIGLQESVRVNPIKGNPWTEKVHSLE